MSALSQAQIVAGVSQQTTWWVNQRMKKLRQHLSSTMSVNPFILPFLFEYHSLVNFDELQDLTIASHLVTGHNTGFGKLIDEKILPQVFGTIKLDKQYRAENQPFHKACFNEVDHIIRRDDNRVELLSQKAGKWTIQLSMAVQLNRAFEEIITNYGNIFDDIVVGVFYGKREGLTDKYDILRGINRGANHDVVDLTNRVFIQSGKDFWAWLNYGEESTQGWVLEGILDALKATGISQESELLLEEFKARVVGQYNAFIDEDGTIDWQAILHHING